MLQLATSASPPPPLLLPLLLWLPLGGLLPHGARAAACGPYLAAPLRCDSGCTQERSPLDGVTRATLRCNCQELGSVARRCTTPFPDAFGPQMPAFVAAPPSRCDELVSFELSGITTVTAVQAGAFAAVAGGLRELRLTRNWISRLADGAFANLTELRELDLSKNHLGSFNGTVNLPDGGDVPRLESLNLSGNTISTLSWRRLSCYRHLKRLVLSGNQLVSLGDVGGGVGGGGGPLALPVGLRSLYLDDIGLRSLSACQYYALCEVANLTTLSLREQQWHCDCDTRWLSETYRRCPTTEAIDGVKCANLSVRRRRKIRSSAHDDWEDDLEPIASYRPSGGCPATAALAANASLSQLPALCAPAAAVPNCSTVAAAGDGGITAWVEAPPPSSPPPPRQCWIGSSSSAGGTTLPIASSSPSVVDVDARSPTPAATSAAAATRPAAAAATAAERGSSTSSPCGTAVRAAGDRMLWVLLPPLAIVAATPDRALGRS